MAQHIKQSKHNYIQQQHVSFRLGIAFIPIPIWNLLFGLQKSLTKLRHYFVFTQLNSCPFQLFLSRLDCRESLQTAFIKPRSESFFTERCSMQDLVASSDEVPLTYEKLQWPAMAHKVPTVIYHRLQQHLVAQCQVMSFLDRFIIYMQLFSPSNYRSQFTSEMGIMIKKSSNATSLKPFVLSELLQKHDGAAWLARWERILSPCRYNSQIVFS